MDVKAGYPGVMHLDEQVARLQQIRRRLDALLPCGALPPDQYGYPDPRMVELAIALDSWKAAHSNGAIGA